ncbi:MAG: acyl-CoA dehydrogenase family protein [Acidimicrobiales bacterium]
MDFSFTEEQEAVRELAARLMGDLATHEELKRVEAEDDRFDRKLWSALADAGLLGLAVPEELGGAGLGFLEACIVLEEAGRAPAAVPLGAVTVLGTLPLVRFGSDAHKARWVGPVLSGDAIVTAALAEPGADPYRPATTATRAGGGWRLQGEKSWVPAGMLADLAVVPATAEAGVGLFLVETAAGGVTRTRQEATDGRIEADMTLDVTIGDDDVLVAPGASGDEALRWLLERAAAAMCVEVAGACQSALKLTAQYTSQREQFGKPVATFQAVGQRAADAYIDTEAVRLTAWQAVWRLANDLPASAEVAVAKFWADDGAQRVVHAAQHLHGGVGVDRDYPLHRYYLLVKHLALSLGGGTASLLRLGDLLADAPA